MKISFFNLSRFLKNVHEVNEVVATKIGEAVSTMLWEEFTQLVQETPQYTGTAAASWNVAMGMTAAGGTGGVRVQGPRTRETALNMGHMQAVSEAMAGSFDDLSNIIQNWQTGDIVIWNDSDSIEHAEYGPLRTINQPGIHAYTRFLERVKRRSIVIQVNRDL